MMKWEYVVLMICFLVVSCFGCYTWGHNAGIKQANSVTDADIIKNFEYILFEKSFGYRHVFDDQAIVHSTKTLYQHPSARSIIQNLLIDICKYPDKDVPFEFNVTYDTDDQCFTVCEDMLGPRLTEYDIT